MSKVAKVLACFMICLGVMVPSAYASYPPKDTCWSDVPVTIAPYRPDVEMKKYTVSIIRYTTDFCTSLSSPSMYVDGYFFTSDTPFVYSAGQFFNTESSYFYSAYSSYDGTSFSAWQDSSSSLGGNYHLTFLKDCTFKVYTNSDILDATSGDVVFPQPPSPTVEVGEWWTVMLPQMRQNAPIMVTGVLLIVLLPFLMMFLVRWVKSSMRSRRSRL